ncbi:hypothetical protein IV67_GL001635 [Weissella minor]|uniref:Uncharacterized protein n=2 Tax=Weissella minor TaxID=1620 RepID=A0A0R2JJ62_9LACO|nr:hypothetical protein IV67_GL001635 [Weissella minor]
MHMVKQGHFAQVNQQKKMKNMHNKMPHTQGQTIQPNQLIDFMLVRYHLSKKRETLVEETNGRLIQEFMNLGQENPWSMHQIMKQVLQQIDVTIPWQFYQVILDSWHDTCQFLLKEVPAAPLNQKIMLVDDLDYETLVQMIGTKLATAWFVGQFKAMPDQLARVTDKQIEQLATSLIEDNQIDWDKVQEIYRGTETMVPTGVDNGTLQWIEQLNTYKKA